MGNEQVNNRLFHLVGDFVVEKKEIGAAVSVSVQYLGVVWGDIMTDIITHTNSLALMPAIARGINAAYFGNALSI